MNWINGFKATNKKEKYQLELRIGTFTVLEIKLCLCSNSECSRFRLMVLNFGFEL